MFICPSDTKKFFYMSLVSNLVDKGANLFKSIYSRYKSQDEEYLKDIEQYKDTDFYEQLLNNPYLVSNNQEFAPNIMQSFGALFGDFSPWASYYGELANKRNQEKSKILDAIRKQEYDLPINQVERERAAGINTDLMGAGSASNPAADIDEQGVAQPPQMRGAGEGVEKLLSITAHVAQCGISLVTNTLGFAEKIQGLQAGSLAMVAQDLNNHSGAMNLLYDEVLNTLPANDLQDIDSLDSQVLLRAVKGLSEDTSFNRKTRDVLSRYYDSISGDSGTAKMQVLKQELAKRYYNSRSDIVDTVSNPRFDKDLSKWISNVGNYFNEYVDTVNKLASRAEQLEYANDIAYYTGAERVRQVSENGIINDYDTSLGSAEGLNDKTLAEAAQLDEEFNKASNKLWKDLADYLEKDNHWYSQIALAFLPGIRAYVEQFKGPKIGFNRNVSNKTVNQTNYHTENVDTKNNYIGNQ